VRRLTPHAVVSRAPETGESQGGDPGSRLSHVRTDR